MAGDEPIILEGNHHFEAIRMSCRDFVELEHPVRGTFVMPAWPVKMSGSSVPVQAAPLLGEHNEEVLGQLLGYSAEQVAALREERVL